MTIATLITAIAVFTIAITTFASIIRKKFDTFIVIVGKILYQQYFFTLEVFYLKKSIL